MRGPSGPDPQGAVLRHPPRSDERAARRPCSSPNLPRATRTPHAFLCVAPRAARARWRRAARCDRSLPASGRARSARPATHQGTRVDGSCEEPTRESPLARERTTALAAALQRSANNQSPCFELNRHRLAHISRAHHADALDLHLRPALRRPKRRPLPRRLRTRGRARARDARRSRAATAYPATVERSPGLAVGTARGRDRGQGREEATASGHGRSRLASRDAARESQATRRC